MKASELPLVVVKFESKYFTLILGSIWKNAGFFGAFLVRWRRETCCWCSKEQSFPFCSSESLQSTKTSYSNSDCIRSFARKKGRHELLWSRSGLEMALTGGFSGNVVPCHRQVPPTALFIARGPAPGEGHPPKQWKFSCFFRKKGLGRARNKANQTSLREFLQARQSHASICSLGIPRERIWFWRPWWLTVTPRGTPVAAAPETSSKPTEKTANPKARKDAHFMSPT